MSAVTVRTLWIVLAGLVSAPLADVLSVVWMRLAPAGADLTAGYFTSVALPALLSVNFLAALALWKLMEPAPVRNAAVFLGTQLVALTLTLSSSGNPAGDVAMVGAAAIASGIAVFGTFRHFFWCGCEPPA